MNMYVPKILSAPMLKKIVPGARDYILNGIVDNQDLLAEYGIVGSTARAMFLAQLCHESAGFRTTEEFATGEAYECRADLGNTEKGDGVKYKGRGLIQLTGRDNYTKYGDLLGINLVDKPEQAATFPLALEVACLYWQNRNIQPLAEQGDIKGVTRRINGGLNGIEERQRWFNKFKSEV